MDTARYDLRNEENDRKEMGILNGIPAFYDYVNTYNSSFQPSTSHATETGLSRFFQRYLLQEAIGVFKWTMPKTWSKDYFLYTLYTYGFVAIINTNKYGVIPQMCSLKTKRRAEEGREGRILPQEEKSQEACRSPLPTHSL